MVVRRCFAFLTQRVWEGASVGDFVDRAAGFIGFHVAEKLLSRGEHVLGVDDLNAYYDVRLKQARLDRLTSQPGFTFRRLDIGNREAVQNLLIGRRDIDRIVHLAAQAGVRHSLVDPYSYVAANVMGHLVMLEAARNLRELRHFVYASSSSVYGLSHRLPFAETDRADTPISVYAASKRAAELISYAFGHLFGIPQTGLRFFTVYGPWGAARHGVLCVCPRDRGWRADHGP